MALLYRILRDIAMGKKSGVVSHAASADIF